MIGFKHPIIGQEAVCPDGLGRVVGFKDNFPEEWIEVETYVNLQTKKYSPDNVRLVLIKFE